MKAITLALVAVAAAVAMTGCANLRTRSAPAKACLTNPCGGFGVCPPATCAPAGPQQLPPPPPPPFRQLEK